MDVVVLTGLLSAALPFLMKMGDKAAESAGSKMGTDAWEMAKKIWDKLHPKVQTKPEVMKAAEAVAESPEDEDCREFLQKKLTKLLNEDPDLVAAIAQIAQANPEAAATVGSQFNQTNTITGDGQAIGQIQSGDGQVVGQIQAKQGTAIGQITGTIQGNVQL